MTKYLSRVYTDTKKVLSTRWNTHELHVPVWAVNAIIYITVLRSLSYGIELLIWGTASSVGPIIAFIAIMGVQTWGVLMILGVLILVIGLVLRNTIIVTIGTLVCAAVWSAFSLVVCLGWIEAGTGGRFAIAALSTAATWTIFFYLQLKSIRMNGVES